MPYKLNLRGKKQLALKSRKLSSQLDSMTELQTKAMAYLALHQEENRYIGANEVAQHYGYRNGWYFRGVLASLHKYGLLDKREG